MAALVFICAALWALYVTLGKKRERKTNIKGYGDLIPDLAESQRARLQEIRRVFLPKVEGIMQDMRLKRADLAELLFMEPSDRTRIYKE